MGTFLDFLQSFEGLKLIIIGYIFWPGSFFITGIIFESRIIPIDRRQSMLFWPGDLTIVPLFAWLLKIRRVGDYPEWGNHIVWWIFVALAMLVVALLLRKNDIKNYPPRSGNSPTKILHDVIGYFIIPTMLIGIGIPDLMMLTKFVIPWLSVFYLLFMFIGCGIMDKVYGFAPEDVIARHPEDWEPIWKTKRIKKY